MRSSLSCARRRRLRCLPSPAASSMSSRRSRGLEVTIASTRPCETTECISLPRPVSDRTSSTSTSRHFAPLRRYSPSPLRSRRREDRDLAHRQVDRAVAVVEHELDLGRRARLHAAAAGEDHVLHRLAADGERRLLAHRPQHGVGDVRLARAVRARRRPRCPAPNSSRVRSGNDLKPLSVSDFRCIALSPRPRRPSSSSSGRPVERLERRAARPPARRASSSGPSPCRASLASTSATTSNVRSCGGPSSAVTS